MRLLSLWVTDQGRIVCYRPSCGGEKLAHRLLLDRGLYGKYEIDGEHYTRMTKVEMRELYPLIANGDLACDGGHVRFDAQKLELVEIEPAR